MRKHTTYAPKADKVTSSIWQFLSTSNINLIRLPTSSGRSSLFGSGSFQVFTPAGWTTTTRMPRGFSSFRNELEKAVTAAFEAEYTDCPVGVLSAAIEEILITIGLQPLFRRGSSLGVSKIGARRFTSICRCISGKDDSINCFSR